MADLANIGNDTDSIAIGEVQLLLSEKRTSLAVMRTGIAVLALPLSVLSVLVATSRYYDVGEVLYLVVPLGALTLALVIFGSYLIVHAIGHMRRYDRLILKIKSEHSIIAEYID